MKKIKKLISKLIDIAICVILALGVIIPIKKEEYYNAWEFLICIIMVVVLEYLYKWAVKKYNITDPLKKKINKRIVHCLVNFNHKVYLHPNFTLKVILSNIQ